MRAAAFAVREAYQSMLSPFATLEAAQGLLVDALRTSFFLCSGLYAWKRWLLFFFYCSIADCVLCNYEAMPVFFFLCCFPSSMSLYA